MRRELKEPIGHLLKGEPATTVKNLKDRLYDFSPPKFAVVGDFTASNIINAGMKPHIIVIDHRTMREAIEPMEHGDRIIWNTQNPAGTITREAWEVLQRAVTLNSEISVIVEGEEDLLVLPLIMIMPKKSIIVYGQPYEGMVVVKITRKLKNWTTNFLSRMEESK